MNSARPKYQIVFAAGNYSAPCAIRISGTADKGIVLRSEDDERPAVLDYSGSTSNVTEIYGAYLTIRGLEFRPNSEDVISIRIMGGARNITIERDRFSGVGNVAISANSGNTTNLTIRDNVFIRLKNTPIYIGCHDGNCSSSNLVFERNYIDKVRAADTNSIGYGIEVKLNS